MSLAIVKKVRAKYPTPLGKEHAAFLIEVARALKMGLLKKTSGTRIKLPKPYSVEVAQDIACERKGDQVLHYDILKDGEGEAKPTWRLVGPIDPARYVDVGASAPEPPQPPSEPDPPADDIPIRALLDEIRDEQTAQGVFLIELRAELAAQHEDVIVRLDRLANAMRKSRPFEGSARFIGTMRGTVEGVEV